MVSYALITFKHTRAGLFVLSILNSCVKYKHKGI